MSAKLCDAWFRVELLSPTASGYSLSGMEQLARAVEQADRLDERRDSKPGGATARP